METILKQTLVEQAKLRKISVKSIHEKIEDLCKEDPNLVWISRSTLERKFRDPLSMSNEEAELVRLALKQIMTEVQLIKARYILSERQRKKAEEIIEKAVEADLSAAESSAVYDSESESDFTKQIGSFYAFAPQGAKTFWRHHLKTYLKMPDVAKAAIMCSSYIGRVHNKNKERNDRIKAYMNHFPFYDNCMIIEKFKDKETENLGQVLMAVSAAKGNFQFEPLRSLAYDKKTFTTLPLSPGESGSAWFINIAKEYRAQTTDYKITAADFAHTASFILFIDKIEWLLGFASSIFANKRNDQKTVYYDKGCTNFKFSEAELGYLCELVYFIEGVR